MHVLESTLLFIEVIAPKFIHVPELLPFNIRIKTDEQPSPVKLKNKKWEGVQ